MHPPADRAGVAWLEAMVLTGAAGVAIPLGGWLAHQEHLRQGHLRRDLLHAVVALGGGALLAAVVLVLLPDGLHRLGPDWAWLAFAAFAVGGVGALWASWFLARKGTPAGQMIAMVLDFVPESIALGAAVVTGESGLLLALLIGLQNLPEGFNAYREVAHEFCQPRSLMAMLGGAALLGPAAGAVGLLAGNRLVVPVVMVAASGAIMGLIFQDIAPKAHRRGHMVPTLGALAGFLLGLAGHLWLV